MQYFPKHFKTTEFFNFKKMNPVLLKFLDELHEKLNTPCFLTSSNDPNQEHSTKSQHYLGNAVDIMFPKWTGTLREILDIVSQMGFTGIGVYPHWQMNGKMIGGLHLDVRPGPRATWMGVRSNGKQVYIALNEDNLKKYNIVKQKIA